MNAGSLARRTGPIAAVAVVALLAVGALVNALQASLSVPDWPRSYGRWILVGEWTGNAVYEHVHRLLAAATGIVLAAFLPAAWRSGRERLTRVLVSLAGTLYGVQVLLGGGIVLFLAPAWLSALHVVLAQLLVAAVVTLAVGRFASLAATPSEDLPPEPRRRLRIRCRWVLGLLVVQIALGAVSRHPATQGLLIVALFSHLAIGLAVTILVVMTAVSALVEARGLDRWLGAALGTLLLLQLAVAVPLFVLAPEPLAEEWPPPEGFPLLHVSHAVLASLLLTTALVLVLRFRRPSETPVSSPRSD